MKENFTAVGTVVVVPWVIIDTGVTVSTELIIKRMIFGAKDPSSTEIAS